MNLTGIQLIVDSGLFVLILLVQFIIYPSFSFIEEKKFVHWHGRYTALIGMIVSPLMLTQVAVEVVHCIEHDPRWLRMVLIAAVWGATFSLSVPCHSRLHREGKNFKVINRLVMSNWLRTLLWSMLFVNTVSAKGGNIA